MATQINNTVSATYAYGTSGSDSAVSNVATANLIEDYSISGYKTSLNTGFRPGQNITYLVHVENNGTLPLYSVTISDDLGGTTAPLTFVEGSGSLNLDGTVTQVIPTSTRPLVFTLVNPLESGERATITFIARVNSSLSSSVTTISNSVTITGREGSTSGTIISVTPSPSITLPLDDFASVSLTKTISATDIVQGEPFSFLIRLDNSGNLDANGVVLTDTLPAGFVINSITMVSNGELTTFGTSDYSVDSLTNTLTLPVAGSSKTISVPASSGGVLGQTLVTITGVISS